MLPFLRLSDVPVAQKRVFVRVDFNVPLTADGQIAEDTRIRAALPGIRHCLEQGAALMLTSHLGRPTEGQFDAALSLAPVAQRLAQLLERPVPLVQGWAEAGWQPEKAGVAPGQVVLLENCRFVPGEKKNDAALAQRLASLCDVYVNDAFGTAHRAEATTHGMAQYAPVACAGPLLAAELDALGRALSAPKRPLVAIVAGSKVSTKLTILESLADQVDQLIVGGGIANTFMAAQGLPVGRSLCEPALVGQARLIIEKMQARGASVPIPTDVVVGSEFAPTAQATTKAVADVAPTDMIFDIGPNTAAHLATLLQGAGTIVWNGPVGVFEFDQFGQGTQAVARAIAGSSAFSIAGGGDTLAAIAKYGIASQVDYISTGGGAFLEFLEGKTLPAVDILQKRAAS